MSRSWPPPPADRSIYFPMSDGVRRAVNLYLPAGFDESTTRRRCSPSTRGTAVRRGETATAVELYRAAGFVVAIADLRAWGRPSARRPASSPPRSTRSAISSPGSGPSWSNGQVAAAGISNLVDLRRAMTASGAPDCRPRSSRASDFDQYSGNVFRAHPQPAHDGPHRRPADGWLGALSRGSLAVRASSASSGRQRHRLRPVSGRHARPPGKLQRKRRGVAGVQGRRRRHRHDPGHEPRRPLDELRPVRHTRAGVGQLARRHHGRQRAGRFQALPDVPMEVATAPPPTSAGSTPTILCVRPSRPRGRGAATVRRRRGLRPARACRRDHPPQDVSYYVLGAGVWKHHRRLAASRRGRRDPAPVARPAGRGQPGRPVSGRRT